MGVKAKWLALLSCVVALCAMTACSASPKMTEEEARVAQSLDEVSDMLRDTIWRDESTDAIYAFVQDGSLGIFLSDGTQLEGNYRVIAEDNSSLPVIDMEVPELAQKSIQKVVTETEGDTIIYDNTDKGEGNTLTLVS